MENKRYVGNEVAIIGLACRYPGAKDVKEFWLNLVNDKESICRFSDTELLQAGVEPELLTNSNYVKSGFFIEDTEVFDAAFFGITAREAIMMDPQHRIMLELAWTALEDSGYDSSTYSGWIGLFAGVGKNTYFVNNMNALHAYGTADQLQIVVANEKDYLPTRIAYKLGLKGPCIAVQTACSSSLVAVHLACQSLISHQCDMALAGGVTIQVPYRSGYLYQPDGYSSPDGHCRAFDAKARGTVFANGGAGIVVLKRLADAIRDRDRIHGVIRGSAVNNDGSKKMGFTAPSPDGQAEVIALALEIAGLRADTIGYVEAHGTGTELGDPIEVAALQEVFGRASQKKGFCGIGSVKTNIGHTAAAAGVAGLIKAVLAVEHGLIPGSLNYEEANPRIDFKKSAFFVNTRTQAWPLQNGLRRSGVSSFGMGGTNAHVVLEQAPPYEQSSPSRTHQLLVWSAKTESALEAATENLAKYLQTCPDIDLPDVAYTLAVGRRAFPYRRALVCESAIQGSAALSALAWESAPESEVRSEPELVFMFPGGGAQYPNMGRVLYENEPLYRNEVDSCIRLLGEPLALSVYQAMYPSKERLPEAADVLKRTRVGLPALFITEYSLAKLWMSWGAIPQAMIGHSLGEYVAACLSGVLSLEDALRLVSLRGELFERLSSGGMLSVPLGEEEVQPLMSQQIWLAAVNAPRQCVVSGSDESVEELAKELAARKIETRRIKVGVAAHSALIDPVLPEFRRGLIGLRWGNMEIPYISNLTGEWFTSQQIGDAEYWVTHARSTVRFSDGMRRVLENPNQVLLEIGPGHALCALARQQIGSSNAGTRIVASMRAPKEEKDDEAVLLGAVGLVWSWGGKINWEAYYRDERRRRIQLPTYPFERERYWIESDQGATTNGVVRTGDDLREWFHVPYWKPSLLPQGIAENQSREPWLVFVDDCGLSETMATLLEEDGRAMIKVAKGESFQKVSSSRYVINAESSADYRDLLGDIAETALPTTIVYLWSVTNLSYRNINDIDQILKISFNGLALLSRALALVSQGMEVSLTVVSNDTCLAEHNLQPEKATLLGPCRVLPLEQSNITCRQIDIRLEGSAASKRIVRAVISEIEGKCEEKTVAYRGGCRWIPALNPISLGQPKKPLMRTGGTVLITGGLGGIALQLSKYLAQTFRANLVLVNHTGLPPRETWDAWLRTTNSEREGTDSEVVRRRVAAVREIESLGSDVMLLEADVADLTSMRAAFQAAISHFERLDGVVHAALVPGGSMLQMNAVETAMQEFRPKVYGMRVLEQVLESIDLDFLVLCSSANALQGRIGMAGYSAANSFLDAFASYYGCKRPETYTVSVNWPRWKGIGSSIAFEEKHAAITGEELSDGISASDGMEVFARVLSFRPAPQVIVIPRKAETSMTASRRSTVHQARALRPPITRRSRSEGSPYVAPRNEIERSIAEIWSEVFGLQEISVDDKFSELGGDSLIAIQVTSRLRDRFGVNISVRIVFERPTIALLSETVEHNVNIADWPVHKQEQSDFVEIEHGEL